MACLQLNSTQYIESSDSILDRLIFLCEVANFHTISDFESWTLQSGLKSDLPGFHWILSPFPEPDSNVDLSRKIGQL